MKLLIGAANKRTRVVFEEKNKTRVLFDFTGEDAPEKLSLVVKLIKDDEQKLSNTSIYLEAKESDIIDSFGFSYENNSNVSSRELSDNNLMLFPVRDMFKITVNNPYVGKKGRLIQFIVKAIEH